MLLYPSTLASGYKLLTLSRLHKYTQANRAYCFTVASVYLVADASKYFPLGGSRTLSSTAMVGINSLIQRAMVGRVRVERTSSDFQSGAPTLYATDPFIKRMLRQE